MSSEVIVKESGIEGKGVFANRDFKKGEIVLKWDTSNILTVEQARKVPEEQKKYLSPHGTDKFLFQQPPERYINHSCDPNTRVVDNQDIAIREIKKGEEITSDYMEFFIPVKGLKCKCGAKNCRGVIQSKG